MTDSKADILPDQLSQIASIEIFAKNDQLRLLFKDSPKVLNEEAIS